MTKTKQQIIFFIKGILVETLDAYKVSEDEVQFIRQGLACQYGTETDDIDMRHVTVVEKNDEPQNAIFLLRIMINNRLLWSYNLN